MGEPSKVIHIRNVSSDVSEADIQHLAQSFGVVSKVVLMRNKNQALVEMPDLASAINLVQYYTGVQPSIRGRNVFLQFSSHQELTTPQGHSLGPLPQGVPGGASTLGSGPLAVPGHHQRPEAQPNRILLVTVHAPLYPISVDVLHQVFSPHGFVEKIVIFHKPAGLQALVQYNNQQSAVMARTQLQGRNIYDGCCTLEIQFSNLQELQVNANNERTRDYTNSSLPEQAGRGPGAAAAPLGSIFGEGAPLYGAAGLGRGAPLGFPGSNPNHALGLHSAFGPGLSPGAMASPAAAAAFFGGQLPQGITGTNSRCTVLVSNLNTEMVDVDKLFNLFSSYGNIVRAKLLHNKPDHALVELAEGIQAEMAVLYLKGVTLFGNKLEVNYSKYPSINPTPDAKDFSNSPLNRFLRTANKNYRHCCAPTRMLHVSSLPIDITEEQVAEHLKGFGTILGTKLIEKEGKRQVLVLFDSPEHALDTLVTKHGTQLGPSTIRIAFSKTTAV